VVVAAGAKGGVGGKFLESTGTIRYAGGNGGTSDAKGGAGGGGSAGAGGVGSVGGNTSSNNYGAGGPGGVAGSGTPGADGGNGGVNNSNGSPGATRGGGGGAGGNGRANGNGGNGHVKISWITVTAASNEPTVCSGLGVNLNASATPLDPRGVLLAEGFNNPTNDWTTSNTSTRGTPANAAWQFGQNDAFKTVPRNPAWVYGFKFNSNDYSQFYISDSDSQGVGGITNTTLTSPVISTVGYKTLSLEFYHYYQLLNSSAKVEVTIDGGRTWSNIEFTTTQGSSGNFLYTKIDFGADLLEVPSLQIRFNYQATFGYWWAIDNVTVSGKRTDYNYSWTALPSGTSGLPAGAGTPSTTNASITANPTVTTTYTVTASTGDGLIGQSSKTVTVTTEGKNTNTWSIPNGWSLGYPPTSLNDRIVFSDNYSENQDVNGCSCVVSGSKNVTIKTGKTMKIVNGVSVLGTNTGAGTLTFENNASLVQINDNASNSGNIIYKRTTPEILKTDYIYWSSPVTGATLGAIQTGTLYYSFDATGNSWVRAYSATPMAKGIGYIVRGAGTWFDTGNITLTAAFEGAPNNGIVPVTIIGAGKNNLIGNPYPSAVDGDAFLAANTGVVGGATDILEGALYFWTHKSAIQLASGIKNAGSGAYAYTSDDYSPFTKLGGINKIGYIAAGQSFFARGSATGGQAKFVNSMRLDGNKILDNSGFLKPVSASKTLPVTATNKIEKNRVWLNLTNTEGAFKQILLGYMTGATNNYDRGYDALSLNGNSFINFYSINNTSLLTIQGRALPIQEKDVVPLGYSSTIVGDFSISIDKTDGALSTMPVFLEDKLTNTTHNLKKGAYTFTTEKGTFNDRFVLSYVDKVTLATNDFEVLENGVLITSKNKEIKINASTNYIDKVFVYDMSGRQIFVESKIDKNEMTISNLVSGNQVLVIKVLLQNNSIVTKKIIF
jgi:hypothetical protein